MSNIDDSGIPEAWPPVGTSPAAPWGVPNPERILGRTDYAQEAGLPEQFTIVIVEDSSSDLLLIQMALTEHAVARQLFLARDGEDAIQLFDDIDAATLPCPDLVIVDLNLPKRNGFDVLRRIRSSPLCAAKPVIILSSTKRASDQDEAHRLGATLFISKPSDLADYLAIGQNIKQLLLKTQ